MFACLAYSRRLLLVAGSRSIPGAKNARPSSRRDTAGSSTAPLGLRNTSWGGPRVASRAIKTRPVLVWRKDTGGCYAAFSRGRAGVRCFNGAPCAIEDELVTKLLHSYGPTAGGS